MKIIVGLFLFLGICTLGNAQTSSMNEEFTTKINEQTETLDKVHVNILQMLKGFNLESSTSEREFNSGNSAYEFSNIFGVRLESIFWQSTLYSLMRDNEDKKIVKKVFNLYCKQTIRSGEISVENINRNLPKIQSTALVNEVTKLRDINISILNTLEFCKN